MTIEIPSWKSFEYVQVWLITEMRDGCVLKTKPIGFAHRNRPMGKNETYSPLSTSLTKGDKTKLTLLP